MRILRLKLNEINDFRENKETFENSKYYKKGNSEISIQEDYLKLFQNNFNNNNFNNNKNNNYNITKEINMKDSLRDLLPEKDNFSMLLNEKVEELTKENIELKEKLFVITKSNEHLENNYLYAETLVNYFIFKY